MLSPMRTILRGHYRMFRYRVYDSLSSPLKGLAAFGLSGRPAVDDSVFAMDLHVGHARGAIASKERALNCW